MLRKKWLLGVVVEGELWLYSQGITEMALF